ncbi:MAG TPA: ABC transporter ATP-binding protein [Candidatus Limnocylindria bacterium]|nr:ABC transporter ATP-binding protein [Candidatus Limnocylindria bacterium]
MEAALEVKDLIKHYAVRGSIFGSIGRRERRVVHAVDGISFTVTPGEILGLVGESGCGKTTTGKLVTRLEAPTSGSIVFQGRDIAGLSQSQLRAVRQDLQIIFQDPYDSLDPRYTVEMAVQEPLRAQGVDLAERRRRVEETLDMVELRPARMFMSRYPHELSGGQRQRVAIARAMIVRPRFVIADEPVSMLDVSIRAGLLTLMRRWNQELGVSFLFITHDLGVARYMSNRIVVMYLGKIVETGLTEAVIGQPKHPYTQMLIAAVPDPDPRNRRVEQELRGEVASAIDPPSGCRFHPRCPIAQAICAEQEPALRQLRDGRLAACHFAE